ncbi:MAG: hypothetical protein NT115_18815 [Proteobacteria bacterium]|nr:hypothetical protein [Pseudomonadota bacterium]
MVVKARARLTNARSDKTQFPARLQELPADTDIVVASAKAYIAALNKVENKSERVNPQTSESI